MSTVYYRMLSKSETSAVPRALAECVVSAWRLHPPVQVVFIRECKFVEADFSRSEPIRGTLDKMGLRIYLNADYSLPEIFSTVNHELAHCTQVRQRSREAHVPDSERRRLEAEAALAEESHKYILERFLAPGNWSVQLR